MLRGIFESSAVSKARDEAELRWPRAIDSWESLTFVLTHDPEFGVIVPESANMRAVVWEGAKANGTPTIKALYTFDDNDIHVLKAEFSDAKSHFVGHA